MKILHVGEYVQGGVATYIKMLLHHPAENDIEDYLVLAEEKSDHDWPLAASHIHYYHYKRSMFGALKTIPQLLRFVCEIQPDIIYCHSTWAGVMMRLPYLLVKKRPKIIYNAHGWAFLRDTATYKKKIYAWIEKVLSSCTDVIVNVSKYEMNHAVEYGIPSEKLRLIYSGIPKDGMDIDYSNFDYYDKNKINLLFVGRFDPQKGVDLLLDAMNNIKRKDIHLTLIGDNVVGNDYCIKKKDSENITFLGWLSYDKLAQYYANCDAVVMPSRWEAFGLVAVEAMKYGKAVIASRNGALPELIVDKENGLIVDFKAENVLEVLPKEKNSYWKMGVKGKELYINLFTVDNMINNTMKCYKSLVKTIIDSRRIKDE
ncbi:MAG: glycosyltransferase family 4 protein [Selenomonas sp.]|uniref:glycosyltransferase family 4 protein n=1 Tax=Selenomonas sp. TaxID=2053611 RepID=UPI0025E72C31|nr:glycosyltransferase family 4 protein [Selenomonas sp.]MCR5438569.1 glycosyltransferase family 4 protein [Selenomonas sp.]